MITAKILTTSESQADRPPPCAICGHDEDDSDGLQLNAPHYVHCQPSNSKDPTQNIVRVAPEDGGGANYSGM